MNYDKKEVAYDMPEVQPELQSLVERIGHELSDIRDIKNKLVEKGHQIKDTTSPSAEVPVHPYVQPSDLVGILNEHLLHLNSIKVELSQFTEKLNKLI